MVITHLACQMLINSFREVPNAKDRGNITAGQVDYFLLHLILGQRSKSGTNHNRPSLT